jgi:tetratricopeptide (TPR) repeat protein
MAILSSKIAKKLSFCCATFFLFSLAHDQSTPHEAFFLKRIREYWKEGDFEIAKRQIRSYLDKYPDSQLKDELHMLLGDLYLQEKNYALALENYQEVKKGTLREKIAYNKILCLYELKLYSDLILSAETSKKYSSLSKEQKDSMQYLWASSLFELAKIEQENHKKQQMLQKSLELFASCIGTPYETSSLLPIAHIHKMLGNDHNACSCFLTLAQSDSKQKEDYLFEAALLQAKFSSESAIKTFQQVVRLKGNRAAAAAYNYLLLLFQDKKYKEVVLHYEQVRNFIDNAQLPVVYYALGKSLFILEDYKQAPSYLLKSLNRPSLSDETRKDILYSTLDCSYKSKNLDLFRQVFSELEVSFGEDPNFCNAILAYAELLKTSGLQKEQNEILSKFIQKYPSHPAKEKILLDLATAAYDTSDWHEADQYLADFLATYPHSKSLPQAWRLRLNCSIQSLNRSPSEALLINRQQFVSLLKEVLVLPHVLTSGEKIEYHYELAKNLFYLEKYAEALHEIEEHMAMFPKSSHIPEMALMRVLCHQHEPNQESLFILHAESFLAEYPPVLETPFLHLHLYNAYLQMSEKSSEGDKNEFLAKAAEHLYLASQSKELSLKNENIEWLADYYYFKTLASKNEGGSEISIQRSIMLFQQLIQDKITFDQGSFLDAKTESRLLKLSTLLSQTRQWQKKADLLENWFEKSTRSSQPQSKFHKQLVLELANTYNIIGAKDKALQLYDLLIRTPSSSVLSKTALLERSKIQYDLMLDSDKSEENAAWMQILNDFKDLEIRKNLYSEPIHLEAALEYVRCKSDVCKTPQEKKEKMIHLLQLLKDNFSSEIEEAMASFPEKKELLEDKAQIHHFYMSFVDAEILRLKASLSHDANEPVDAANVRVESLLSELQNNPSLPSHLRERIEQSKQEMKNSL